MLHVVLDEVRIVRCDVSPALTTRPRNPLEALVHVVGPHLPHWGTSWGRGGFVQGGLCLC